MLTNCSIGLFLNFKLSNYNLSKYLITTDNNNNNNTVHGDRRH